MSEPGPGPFGRSVIVGPGEAPPRGWDGCSRVVVPVDALARPGGVVEELHEAWASRTPVVIELGLDPASVREAPSVPGTPWDLGVDLDVPADRLHFLLWANTWDARGEQPVWWWGVKAARLVPGGTVLAEGAGDVRTGDGVALWVDGGPRQPWAPEEVEGLGVVHRESVGRGEVRVAPPPRPSSAVLEPDQRAAVEHRSGPARIIAPAGSGKTRVLTERLRHLVRDRGWEAGTVLALAYNVKARDEMQERTEGLGVRVQTLNGLAHALLREHRGSAPTVIDEREVRRLLDPLAPPRRRLANTDPLGPYLEALTEVRLGLRDPAEVERERGDVPGFAEMVDPYRHELARRGVVDFDEQVCAAIEALLGDGPWRRRVQERHPHLLVDELQDLTPAHVLLVRLVVGPGLDLFGVGDDDQVIYGHAGADPRFLIDFARWFPGGGEHALEVNHRSSAPIVEAAATLLRSNHRRVAKVIRPRHDAPADAGAVTARRHGPTEGAEALLAAVTAWTEDGGDLDDVAVLARVHALLMAPQVALHEAGIPVRSTVGTELLDRTGSRAALAYLRLAQSPGALDPSDLAEVYRRPSRGLPQWITKWFRRSMSIDELRGLVERIDDAKVGEKLLQLADDLALLPSTGATTREVLEVVRDRIGLGEAMAGLDRSKGGEGTSQLDDLEALLQVADLHPEPEGFEPWLRAALTRRDPQGPAVTLSTVHRVKGREWPHVVVLGVTAGLLPHRLAADPEEERRVFHVAITRARDQLVVLGDASRPSPFLDEMTGAVAPRPPTQLAPRVAAPSAGRREGGRAGAGPPLEGVDGAVEGALREWRRERSRADGVPAYVVASDATLRAIATRRPASLRELGTVPGIGPAKLQRYGAAVLEVIAAAGSPAPG